MQIALIGYGEVGRILAEVAVVVLAASGWLSGGH